MNAVEIHNLTQRYGTLTVLENLSLTLGEGEVLGLFGHNGAGKTTTMKLVLGLLNATEGQVRVLGCEPNDPQVRRTLGYLPENVTFYAQLSGRETLRHFARLKGATLSQTEQLLEQVGLSHAADRKVRTYSKGMRQRLGLAQALLGEPRLLLLDEPTVGLDPVATEDLYSLIDGLRQQGCSVILCSHVLPGVERLIDRGAILAGGRLQAVGTLSSLRHEAALPERIRVSGVVDRELWIQRWNAAGHSATPLGKDGIEVVARGDQKLDLLRELLAGETLTDIEIHQPSLTDLYRHYMDQASEVPA